MVSSNLFVGYFSSNNLVTLNGGNLTVTNALTNGVLDVRRGTFTLNSGTITLDALLLTNSGSSVMVFNGGSLVTKSTTVSNGAAFTVGNATNAATLNLQGGTHTFINGLNISSNATLSGVGTVLGAATVNAGGTLAPGNSVGTLTISNNLVVNNAAVLQYELGTNSDRTVVSSNLTLAGTLNITDAGGFTNGTYTLFTYGGTLTTNGSAGILTIGTVPDANLAYKVDISSNGYVNLAAEPPPVASFTGSPTNGVVPLPVTFTDSSTGMITNRQWNFGDGAISSTTATNVSHTYTVAGTNTVSLTVSGPFGTSVQTRTNYIIVALTPAHLVVSPASRNYGIVTVGQSSNQTFSVMNTGQQTLTGSVSVASGPFAVVSGNPYTVPGSGTNTVTVSFNPVAGGIFTSAVIFVSNGGDSTNAVAGLANSPPVAVAGSPQTVVLPACATLNGSAADDGRPYGTLTTLWSRFSGPGTVTFGDINVTNTTACFSTNGTYVLLLTASDGAVSSSDTITMTVRLPPQITTTPVATNELMQVGNLGVVAGNEPMCFTAGAYDPDGDLLSCLWDFGDGATSTDCDPCHVFTNCGPHTVSVAVNDGYASTNTTSPVTVACQLTVTKMQGTLNFAKTNADSCTVKGMFSLQAGYNFAGKLVTLDIGGTNVSFTLDSKGKWHNGPSTFSKPTYNKKTGRWTFNATLKQGSWQTAWAEYSMLNTNTPKQGILVTSFPVTFVVDTEAFMGTTNLQYTAKHGKSGTAKLQRQ